MITRRIFSFAALSLAALPRTAFAGSASARLDLQLRGDALHVALVVRNLQTTSLSVLSHRGAQPAPELELTHEVDGKKVTMAPERPPAGPMQLQSRAGPRPRWQELAPGEEREICTWTAPGLRAGVVTAAVTATTGDGSLVTSSRLDLGGAPLTGRLLARVEGDQLQLTLFVTGTSKEPVAVMASVGTHPGPQLDLAVVRPDGSRRALEPLLLEDPLEAMRRALPRPVWETLAPGEEIQLCSWTVPLTERGRVDATVLVPIEGGVVPVVAQDLLRPKDV